MNRIEFVLNELMKEDFFEKCNKDILLEEKEESGKSELHFILHSRDGLCIKNVDHKGTELNFFRIEKALSLYKRVDHIVFEKTVNDCWKVYLIEMKSKVNCRKWTEVKGKYRASYLLVEGIIAMLGIQVEEISMFTTFESVDFKLPETISSVHRPGTGRKIIMEKERWDEWNGIKFSLNLGEQIPFLHTPVQMKRDDRNILTGRYAVIGKDS